MIGGGTTPGGVTPPPPPPAADAWIPAVGTAASIGYAAGAHPTDGKAATVSELTPQGKSWNPAPSTVGPWGGTPQVYNFPSIQSYCGGAWSATMRRFIMFGGGHSSFNVPVPYSFSAVDLSWRWEAVPVPSDGLEKCSKAFLTRPLVEAQYPTAQFNFDWGEWSGDWSGWPAGFSRPGEVFPEPSHSYQHLLWVPGSAIGNSNGALLLTAQATGVSTGSAMLGGTHHFNLDTGKWVRNANTRTGTSSQNSGIGGGSAWLGGAVNRAFAINTESSTFINYADVWNPTTKTWARTTSTNSIPITGVNGGLMGHEASGLLILPVPETAGGVVSYLGTRHRFYAAAGSEVAAGGHTWGLLTVSATSWPSNTVGNSAGSITGMGWTYCSRNGCFYGLPCGGGATLWKLAPPAGAASVAEYLSGIWTITSETVASGVRMRGLNDEVISASVDSANTYNRLVWDEASGCLLYFDMSVTARVQAIRPQGV